MGEKGQKVLSVLLQNVSYLVCCRSLVWQVKPQRLYQGRIAGSPEVPQRHCPARHVRQGNFPQLSPLSLACHNTLTASYRWGLFIEQTDHLPSQFSVMSPNSDVETHQILSSMSFNVIYFGCSKSCFFFLCLFVCFCYCFYIFLGSQFYSK